MSRLRKMGLTIDDPLAPGAAKPTEPPRPRARRPPEESEPAQLSKGDRASEGPAGARPQPAAIPDARGPSTDPASRTPASRAPQGDRSSETAVATSWRSWSGATRVASYRLPDELLIELAASADELRLQVGLMVTAAITHLLDQPDTVIGELVDRADDARIRGRRATRGRRQTDEQAQVAVGPSTR
jgi:hypothetical protein